jgi:hypothetical protein
VLLFDEPVTGLDPEGILWARTLLQSSFRPRSERQNPKGARASRGCRPCASASGTCSMVASAVGALPCGFQLVQLVE